MPRKTATINLSSYQRKKILQMEREFAEEGRHRWADQCKAILLLADGYDMENTCKIVGRAYSTVQQWSRSFRRTGIVSLVPETSKRGRKKKLGNHERNLLSKAIVRGPQAAGYLGNVWTSSMVSNYIEKRWNVKYHPGHVRRLLNLLGFSIQFPREKLALADVVAQDKWLNETYPDIKKKPIDEEPQSSSKMKHSSSKKERPDKAMRKEGKDSRSIDTPVNVKANFSEQSQ
jgi:transposase